MKRIPNIFLISIICTCATLLHADTTFGKTFFTQRSQGSNAARENVGVEDLFPLCEMDCLNGLLSATPEYTRTFSPSALAKYLFFTGTTSMTFGPAGTATIFGRNFFLNDNFVGTVTASPRVQNFLVDFDFRLGLDEWISGLYIKAHAPIVWTDWNVNLEATTETTGTGIQQFALGNASGSVSSPVTDIIQAYKGQTLNISSFPDLKETLAFARIDGGQTQVTVADVEVALGYNFICNECSYFGVNIRTIFPCGNRPNAAFIFEPIVGNGHHYELGAGIDTHYEFWSTFDSSFGIFTNANIYHVFKAKQRRVFDLIENGIGSRNLLIKQFSDPLTYAGIMLYGPNVLALECHVKNDYKVDAAFVFDYKRGGLTIDFGYNLWARSQDKITITEHITPNTYALAGQTLGTGSDPNAEMNRTGSTARINGTGGAPDGTSPADNVFISDENINPESAATPNSLSNKLFAHIGYSWECYEYMPFLGLGGEVEVASYNALNQWGIWLKGGFSFI